MKARVIGSPINHSLSPLIFNYIKYNEKVVLEYLAQEVSLLSSDDFFDKFVSEKLITGLNVTIPLKEKFISRLNYISPEVESLGALNVIYQANGKVSGFNTDVIGIENTLKLENFNVENKTCYIFGAGGAARATAYVLGSAKAKNVFIQNRSSRSLELIEKFQKLFSNTNWIIPGLSDSFEIDLIINSTPIGMSGKSFDINSFDIMNELTFSKNALAFDLVYTPAKTCFLQKAQSLNLKTVGGIGMLVDQAIATWEIWIGAVSNKILLRSKLIEFLNGVLSIRENKKPIFLTGFMGVGKSSVGLELSALLGLKFLDIDKLIEIEENQSIENIFKLKGEKHFRELESKAIAEVTGSASEFDLVVALGGGALINTESYNSVINAGTLVCLNANERTIKERIEKQNHIRPLFQNLAGVELELKIKDLINMRKEIYNKSKIQINTDKLELIEVVFEVISSIGRKS